MQYIPISSPRVAGSPLSFAVDDEDAPACLEHRWCLGNRYPGFGCGPRESRRRMLAHTFLMQPPSGLTVDHVNGDIMDNRRRNLEVVTIDENKRRNKGDRGSVIHGVRWSPSIGLWLVFTREKGNHKLCGAFDDMHKAIEHKRFGSGSHTHPPATRHGLDAAAPPV